MSAEILRQVWLFSGLSRDQLDALSRIPSLTSRFMLKAA